MKSRIRAKRIAPPLVAILLGLVLTAGAVLVLEFWPGPHSSKDQSAPLIFLIPVLVTSALGGWAPGACIALIAATAWNWFFLPPIGSLSAESDGMFTIAVFLVVAAVVGQVPRLMQRAGEYKRVAEVVQGSEQRYRAFFELNAIGAGEVELTNGQYLRVNGALCEITGHSREELLTMTFADITHPDDRDSDEQQFSRLVRGEIATYQLEKRYVRRDGRIIWVQITTTLIRDSAGRPLSELGLVLDITERRRADQELQRLSAHLLQLQDEERRRIAQQLHDETAQTLAASNINLTVLLHMDAGLDEEARSLLHESLRMGEQVLREVRTLSYVVHPPLLDELGLASALAWYVDGFSRRSGIEVELSVPPDLERLPSDVETALYRVVQESLTNMHRHAGSDRGSIRLARENGHILLEIEDQGHGMAVEANGSSDDVEFLGVGIAGMRQRIHQLGGQFDLRSSQSGTTIIASVPTDGALGRYEVPKPSLS